MFEGLESVGTSVPLSQSEAEREQKTLEDTPSLDTEGSVTTQERNSNAIEELRTRVEDIEDILPQPQPLNSFDTPMQLLPSTALLPEVISAVNELIKRNAR